MSERYGNTRMSKIRAAVNDLRAVIREQGTPDIQGAWDRLEPWLDADIWAEKNSQDRKGQ